MENVMPRIVFFLLLSVLSTYSFAQADRVDFDLDDNGLIEINDWVDLNEIRNNLDGTTLYGQSTGCPDAGCVGFELATDLNFDSNLDGILDAQDDYWDDGRGWNPVGSNTTPFTAIFDGQGFVIRNLMINRTSSFGGLFGVATNATFRRVRLEGDLLSITASSVTGGLVGIASATKIESSSVRGAVRSSSNAAGGLAGTVTSSIIERSFTTGSVTSSCYSCSYSAGGLVARAAENTHVEASFSNSRVSATGTFAEAVGGLVGMLDSSVIRASYAKGDVSGSENAGGLVGLLDAGDVRGSYSIGKISGYFSIGGLIGAARNSAIVADSYWATDASDRTHSAGGVGATLAQLRCPLAANNLSCLTSGLYDGWDGYVDSEGSPYWFFGDASTLPVLRLDGEIYRDTDGDGAFDFDDAFPALFAASEDSDGDGAVDRWTTGCDLTCRNDSGLILDQFPLNAAAMLDLDLDGMPEAWNSACDLSCQSTSGLILDSFPNDEDNDGIPDAQDADTDGVADVDADSNGLVEVSSLVELDAVRYALDGTGRRLSDTRAVNSSGCPARIVNGVLQRKCIGYELTADLDLDSNGDGVWSSTDIFWNRGQGWQPIGSSAMPFTGIFNGNGHVIRNMWINRPGTTQGLFGQTQNAHIKHVGIVGPLTSIKSSRVVGLLIGNAQATSVEASYAVGSVEGASTSNGNVDVGGLIGTASGSSIKASFASGLVKSLGQRVGGLIGSSSGTTIAASYSTSYVVGMSVTGNLVGYVSGGSVVDSFWAKDVNKLHDGSGTGVSLAELKCPTSANNTDCAGVTLYETWASYQDEDSGAAYWNFGSANQLPALAINGRIVRDSDGDGALDEDDAFPLLFAASSDSDGDGAPDRLTPGCDEACRIASGLTLDQFPQNAAVIVDLDLDGLPDSWAPGCDANCQSTSGLTLDPYPNDVNNNGIPDAQENNSDYADRDANGLIEISTLEALDAVRHSLAGHGRRMNATAELDSSGCPPRLVEGLLRRWCQGYELTTNLDFDTSGDGLLSSADIFWNQGTGWVAIGSSYSNAFTGTFDGKGFVIRNLAINRPNTNAQGLFGYINNANLRNLKIEGNLVSVRGNGQVGGLVGYMINSEIAGSEFHGDVVSTYYTAGGLVGLAEQSIIKDSHTSGRVSVEYYESGGLVGRASNTIITGSFSASSTMARTGHAGGLIGIASDTSINGSFAVGDVTSEASGVGGLVGQMSRSSITASYAHGNVTAGSSHVGGLVGGTNASVVEASYATGRVEGGNTSGGLIGDASTTSVINSYWATDLSGMDDSEGGIGFTTNELICPTAANNLACAANPLYTDWDTYTDADGIPYWNFGTSDQLPVLVINGQIYRDSDGDRVFNIHDDFPNQVAASKDSDGDGAPDYWNPRCDNVCRENSGLILDQFPYQPAATVDLDLDGMPDLWNSSCDASCRAASGLVIDSFPNDVDNDGITDAEDDDTDGVMNADIGSNGLISIFTLEQLDAIRYNLAGTGRVVEKLGDRDSSGCPITIENGVLRRVCHGYELMGTLNFDTNQDGALDAQDWRDGNGWEPIGGGSEPFKAVFEGNGYEIQNLRVTAGSSSAGFFGRTEGADIRNLGLTGPHMLISGRSSAGALIGSSTGDRISGCYATGTVTAASSTGGLIGYAKGSTIIASFTTGSVSNRNSNVSAGGLLGSGSEMVLDKVFSTARVANSGDVGGLVGRLYNSQISEAYSVGYIETEANAGGLIGSAYNNTYADLYWATDESGRESGAGGRGATLSQLKCPTAPNTNNCAEISLYENWSSSADSDDGFYWDFGTSNHLPRLMLYGVARGDSDGDSVEDLEDVLPLMYAVAIDSDGDGFADEWNERCDALCRESAGIRIDAFPENQAASLDTDNDGYPDAWNEGCDTSCQQNSRLRLDSFPNDPAASLDADGDGHPDRWNENCDAACQATSGLTVVPAPDASKPTIYGVPDTVEIAATGEMTLVTLLIGDIVALDLVDPQHTLVYEASLAGTVLSRNEEDQVQLPAGALDIDWVAVDPSGNRSDSVKQRINVYPQARFGAAEVITGKPSEARLPIGLSGPSPVYPIVVDIYWHKYSGHYIEGLTEVNLDELSVTIHNETELADAALVLPINDIGPTDDGRLEFEIISATAGETEPFSMRVQEDSEQLWLIVTDTNLAPQVSLKLYQDDAEVALLGRDGGPARIVADIIDPNGKDTHQLEWDVSELNVNVDNDLEFTFDPYDLLPGEYSVTLGVTDNGTPALSATTELQFTVREQVQSSSSSSSSSSNSSSSNNSSSHNNSSAPSDSGSKGGGGGGGSINLLFLLFLCGVGAFTSRQRI